MNPEEYLAQLRGILPQSEPWERWLEKTGELPPDFDAMPSCAGLPDPLDGVSNPADWTARREELKGLFARWVLGTIPPRPDEVNAKVLSERVERGVTLREVELSFGPGGVAKLHVDLTIPPGDGPFPVFMTQHSNRAWTHVALSRGYIGCHYAGADSRDDTDTFLAAYPDCDWSRLMRRAWAGGRALDYLEAEPRADASRVAITGHSRNGKQSLMASAFDERFALVISSSSGAGGSMPARLYSNQHMGEGIESITRAFPEWFHPRLRFFTGREHKLPVDFHELIALSAPRPCLLSCALNDNVEDVHAMENAYLSAKRVWEFLDAPDNLRILWRWGQHDTSPKTIERYLDWCDLHFGRGDYGFPERLFVPHNWKAWGKQLRITLDREYVPRGMNDLLVFDDGGPVKDASHWAVRREELLKSAQWLLGEEPPGVAVEPGRYGGERPYASATVGRAWVPKGCDRHRLVIGDYVNMDVYAPEGAAEAGKPLATVLYLPPACGSMGYGHAYSRLHQLWDLLAVEGFVVACFDPIGYGLRIEEAEGFYDRYPRWSLMGKMVRDVRSALEVLCGLNYVDNERLFAFGYAMGATVGLFAAALDERLRGLAAVSPPPPFRLDVDEAETGGLRRWSHDEMWLPRLGHFIGEESRLPCDVHHLYAAIAPRPLLAVTPQLDREAPVEKATLAVDAARKVYGLLDVGDHLHHETPEDYNCMSAAIFETVMRWLKDTI